MTCNKTSLIGVEELKLLDPSAVNKTENIINLLLGWAINLFVTSKNEFSNSPNHEFKVLQNVFKIKRQGLRFFKVINKN